MFDVPVLRHIEDTPYGPRVHRAKPMLYHTSNRLLKQLGREAGYRMLIDHYAFRQWTANVANPAFTDQERNRRILGHSGTWIFEKHYNDHFIHRDVQIVVLLRPPLAELIRAVARMSRNRDPMAPKDLSDEQRRMLCRDAHLTNLRMELATIRREICFGERSLKVVRNPELHKKHGEINKAIARRRQELLRQGKDRVKQAYYKAIPVLEIDKQIDAVLGLDLGGAVAAAASEDHWMPPQPFFSCPEQGADCRRILRPNRGDTDWCECTVASRSGHQRPRFALWAAGTSSTRSEVGLV